MSETNILRALSFSSVSFAWFDAKNRFEPATAGLSTRHPNDTCKTKTSNLKETLGRLQSPADSKGLWLSVACKCKKNL